MWCTLILIGLVGQFAWTIENMYFNVFLYNTISTDPGYISAMVGWSAAAATLTTLLMGALSDRVGKRKLFICGGYILWGLSTAAFGFITVENAAKLFPAAQAAAAAATMVVVLDCAMTFFGSTANDAAFNAYITDAIDSGNRGKTESVLAILPLISMLVIFGAFDGMTQRGEWQKFFAIFGGLVTLAGFVGIFLVAEPRLTPKKGTVPEKSGLWPAAVRCEGERGAVSGLRGLLRILRRRAGLFPYLIIYIQNYLKIDNYAVVLGVVLLTASGVSVASGKAIDRWKAPLYASGGRRDAAGPYRHVLRARDAGCHSGGLHHDVWLHARHGGAFRRDPRSDAGGQGRSFSGHPHDLRCSAAHDRRPGHRRSRHPQFRQHLC